MPVPVYGRHCENFHIFALRKIFETAYVLCGPTLCLYFVFIADNLANFAKVAGRSTQAEDYEWYENVAT